jgi:hypothetical protein
MIFGRPAWCKSVDERIRKYVENLYAQNKHEKNYTLEEIKVSDLTIDGIPAKRVAYTSNSYNFRARGIMYLIIIDDKECSINFTIAPPEKYDEYAKMIDEMVDSFEWYD